MLTKALSGNWSASGELSLQNALSLAMNGLKYAYDNFVVDLALLLCFFPFSLFAVVFSLLVSSAIRCVCAFFRHIPSHASREVLVIMGSLTSCDPGNIFTTIEVCLF